MQTAIKVRQVADIEARATRIETAYYRLLQKSDFHLQQNNRYSSASLRAFMLRMDGIASNLDEAKIQRLHEMEASFITKRDAHWKTHWHCSSAALQIFHIFMFLTYGSSFYKERYQEMTNTLPKNVFSR